MYKHEFEIILSDERDRTEFIEFIEMYHEKLLKSEDLKLEVSYQIPDLSTGDLGLVEETVVNIILLTSSVASIVIPIIQGYLNKKGKKRIIIVDKKDYRKIDISNLSGVDAAKVIDSYCKSNKAQKDERK